MLDQVKLQAVVVGDPSVGKTSLIRKYAYNKFSESYIETVRSDLTTQKITINVRTKASSDQLPITLLLYDIGGQTQFLNGMVKYAKNAHVFIICYDVTKYNTFNSVISWVEKIKCVANADIVDQSIILVGNKSDLLVDVNHCSLDRESLDQLRMNESQIPIFQLTDMCRMTGISHGIETSAKTGDNVASLFDTVSKVAYNSYIRQELKKYQTYFPNLQDSHVFLEKNGFMPEFCDV